MNFRDEREKRGWSLQLVAEKTGYSVAAINGLELHNKGGYELRVKLHRLYGDNEPVPYAELQDRTPPTDPDLDIWRRRAKAAERELHLLKTGMRKLLGIEGPEHGDATPERSASGALTEMVGSSWDRERSPRTGASQPVIGEKIGRAIGGSGSGPGHGKSKGHGSQGTGQ